MKKNNKNGLLWMWILLNGACILCIIWFCIPQLTETLQGKQNITGDIIRYLYPRFDIEKHRFEPGFFIGKAYQFIWRYIVFICLPVSFLTFNPGFRNRFFAFFSGETKKDLSVYIPFLAVVLMYFLYDSITDLLNLKAAEVFYKPTGLLRWLIPQYPASWILYTMYAIYIASLLLLFIKKLRLLASMCLCMYLLLFQTCVFGFEKTDHHLSTLTYVMMLMCLWCWYEQKEDRNVSWILELIRIAITLPYLLSGLEKILNSGTHWIDPDNFRWFLYAHPTHTGTWVASSDLLCILLPAGALVFQLSFVLILFLPRMRGIIISAGIAFHIGNYILFGIGHYIHPWYCLYFFYFEPEEIIRFIRGTFLSRWLYLNNR